MQLSVQNLLALNLTGIRDETVHQLHVRHFQREEGQRNLVVGGNVLGHRQRKRRLTHSGAASDNHQVRGLPARRLVVQFVVARWHARKTVLVLRRLVDDIDGILDDRVYLGVLLLHVLLRQLEECALGVLHQVVHVDGLVEGLRLNVAGKLYELPRQKLLCDDVGMILNVGRRSHTP